MKTNKLTNRIVSILLTLCVVLVCLQAMALTAFAAEISQDGLEVTLTTDKNTYAQGETVAATLTVKNTNSFAVSNVSLEGLIPEGYALASGDRSVKQVDTLAQGETVTLTVRLVPEQTGGEIPTTAPTTPPVETPETGDDSPLAMWMVLLILSAMGMAVLTVKFKLWKRTLSLLLILAMLATMLPVIPLQTEAAEADGKTIHISTTVQAEGEPVEIKATVTYELPAQDVHTVQFVLNYEGAPEINAQQVADGACAVQPEGVSREGYTFAYWFTREFEGPVLFDLSQPITKDMTLYAHWIEEGAAPDMKFTTFYKVSFGYPDSMTEEEQKAVYLPEEQLVYENALVYSLDAPIMDGYVFAAWYYDSAMTQMAGAEDVITKDTVLYPLMLKDTAGTEGMPTNNYVAAPDVTDMQYAVTVKAPSMQAVKDGLIWLDVARGGQLMDMTVTDNGDGTYTVRSVKPLEPGKTYQLRVQDREKMPATGMLVNALDSYIRFFHNGELQSIDVEYYNIFTDAREVNNLKLSNGLVLIPIGQVTGMDLEEAVSLISLAPDANGEMGLTENAQTGTFQYTGSKTLQPGDVVFIYEGDPAAVEAEYAASGTVSAATNSTFVKIAAVEGNTCYYGTPELKEVLFMPDVLPIHRAEDTDGNPEDNTVTVADKCLDFGILPVESAALNKDTVAEPGDFIAFYSGVLDNPSDIRYAKILTVERSGGFTTLTFEDATMEDIQSSVDSYVHTYVNTELTEQEQVTLQNKVIGQALDSGFAEKAAALAVQDRLGLEEAVVWGQQYPLTRRMAKKVSADLGPDVDIDDFEIDAGVFLIQLQLDPPDVNADITSRLRRITTINGGEGLRVAFGVYIPVGIEIVNAFTQEVDESLKMDLYVTMEQEFAFDVTMRADYGIDLEWLIWESDAWLDLDVSFEIGTYTGVGTVIMVDTEKNYEKSYIWDELVENDGSNGAFTSAESLTDQLNAAFSEGDTGLFSQYTGENGDNSLINEYRKMLQKDADYLDILAIPLAKYKGKIIPSTPVGDYKLSLELVFAAKVNVSLGTSFETMSVKRYGFSIRASLQDGLDAWANPTVDKQTPYHSLNLMIMGNLGLRAGVRFTGQIGLLDVRIANVGMMVEVGAYVDLYGFGYFHYGWSADGGTNVQKAGAMYVDIGMYMDIDLSINALMDMLTATFHVLEMEVSFFRLGTREYLVDVTPYDSTLTVSRNNRFDTRPFDFGRDAYRIMYVDIVNGDISYRTGHPANFIFRIPAEYQDKLMFRKYDFFGNLKNEFYVSSDVDEMELEIPVRIVFKDSVNQAGVSTLDSIYDLIGEAAGTKTVKWSRGKTNFSLRYNRAIPNQYFDENGNICGSDYVTITRLKEMDPIPLMHIDHLAPKVPGMDFAGWEVNSYDDEETWDRLVIQDFSDMAGIPMVVGDVYLTPLYTPRDDTKYTVRHLVPTLADPDDYEVYLEETFTGRTHGGVEALDYYRYDIAGISVDHSRLPIASTFEFEHQGEEYVFINFTHSIRNDGRTVLDLYYKRDACRVTVFANNPVYHYYGATSSGVTTQVKFGEPVTDPGYAHSIPGYTFLGWSTTADGSAGILESLPGSLEFTAEQERTGIAYYAIWEPEKVDCTVSYYLQDPFGEYQFLGTEQQKLECGTRLRGYALKPESIELPDITFDGRVEAYTDVPYTRERITYDPAGYTIHVYYDQLYYKVVLDKVEQYYLWGEELTFPKGDEKEGYVFRGWQSWDVSDTNLYRQGESFKVTTTPHYFYPVYTEADDVKYTVKHYLQLADGTYSQEPYETEEFFDGTTNSFVSPAVKSYPGFESPLQKSERVQADGSTVVEYHYRRKSYDVRVEYAVPGEDLILRGKYTSSYRYGVPFSFMDAYDSPLYIARPGYRIAGWYLADEALNPDQTLLDSESYLVEGDALFSEQTLVFKPMWEKVPIEYQVEHYVEQLDGTYVLQKTDKLTAYIQDEVTAQAARFVGFTYDAANSGNVLSGQIALDGSLVLKLHYTRNFYDAKWYDYDGTTLLTTTRFLFGQTVTAPEVSASREGYTFAGWNAGTVTMPVDGISFNAKDHGSWTANTYKVHFDANGGSGTMAEQSLTYDRLESLKASAFAREGYTFAGWSLTADGTVRYADQAQVINLAASGTVTLYAQWEAGTATAYQVVYYGENLDGNGYEAIKTENRTGVTGANAAATAIEIPGFTYDAANSENVLSGEIAADGSLVLKLYYRRNSYTLTLDFNGESMKRAAFSWDILATELLTFEVADQTFTYRYGQPIRQQDLDAVTVTVLTGNQVYDESTNSWVDETKEVPFRDAFAGYSFAQWDSICDTMPAEDLTLTAQWTAMDVTVRLLPGINYSNGQQVAGDPIVITAKYGDVIDLTPYGFTDDGFFMSGWNYNPDLTAGTEIVGELVLVDGYYDYSGTYSVSGGIEAYNVPAGEVHIYGSWVRDSYKCTITFDPNCSDSTGMMTNQLVGTDSKWTALKRNRFVRRGYRFIGWSLTPDGEVVHTDGSLPTWDEEEVTLYAQWEAIP